MNKYRVQKFMAKFAIHLFLILVAILAVFPIIYVICASFKTNSEIMVHPESVFPIEPTLQNYKIAWTSSEFNILSMFTNSTIYTVSCVCFTIITSSMGGYVFARGEFRGKNFWLTIFTSLMFISIGTITVYPLFEILNIIDLSSSLYGLLVVKVFAVNIVQIYLVRGFINSLPKALDESAEIDGCGFFGTFVYIIFPMLKPIIATIGILSFQGSWNEYMMPTLFTLTRPEQRTLIVGVMALKSSGEAASSWNLMLAGTTVALLPVLIAYSIGNKYFVKGIASGAVKG